MIKGFQHPRHGTPQVPSFRPEELLGDLEFHDLQLLWSSVRPTKMVPEAEQYADTKVDDYSSQAATSFCDCSFYNSACDS